MSKGFLSGSQEIGMRAATKMTKGMVMGRCTGLTAVSIKVSGNLANSTERASLSWQMVE